MRFESRRPTFFTVADAGPAGVYLSACAGRQHVPACDERELDDRWDHVLRDIELIDGARVWHDAPLPAHECGTRTLSSVGASLMPETPAALLFHGGQDLAQLVDPLARCAYGEHQYGLYEARGAYSIADLLDASLGKHVVILRGHAREQTPFNGRGGIGKHVVETRTTVYVTFARVR